MVRLGFVPYCNAFPFRGLLSHSKAPFEESIAVPSELNRQLLNDEIDIALSSSALCIDHALEFLPNFCIASTGSIESVMLYQPQELPLEKTRFYLDPHSLTSNTLFLVLAKHYWNFEPILVDSIEEANGFLKIGDYALKTQLDVPCFIHDLGECWNEMTGLPFVYALFLYKKSFKELHSIKRYLHFSYEAFLNDFEHHLHLFSHISNIPLSVVRQYFNTCQYRLTSKHLEGLALFKKLAKESYVLQVTT